jgi:molecular chaperone HscA
MEDIEARILISNLLARVVTDSNGSMNLPGVLTAAELQALRLATAKLDPTPAHRFPVSTSSAKLEEAEIARQATAQCTYSLDTSVLKLPPVEGMRLCLDFGTAMSKATLVLDGETEQILVLELGIPGDQEQVSSVMLISSVYIDNAGLIWFGKNAVDHSLVEGQDGSRQRLDNIKRRLSEGGFDDMVRAPLFAPTGVEVTYGQMILAYLMFLTWATNRSLETRGFARNIRRRFAMPCFPSDKSRDVSHGLRKMLGEAQVLADTFSNSITTGLPVSDFARMVKELKSAKLDYPFMAEDITEPLGVAGALLSWRNRVDMLVMVIDVGAGTSDLSLYRILVDPDREQNTAQEVAASARGITEAGNYLDRILIEFILRKAGVTSSDDDAVAARSKLELNIRDYKETLFNEEFVFVALTNVRDIEVNLNEFLELEAVRGFGKSLHDAMKDILEAVDNSVVNWVLANPARYLTVALTGGGAMLPMVKDLAKGTIAIRGQYVPLQAALPFPLWLQAEYADLQDDFARIAVSLGGARKRLVQRGSAASILGGDVAYPLKIDGYYQRGT